MFMGEEKIDKNGEMLAMGSVRRTLDLLTQKLADKPFFTGEKMYVGDVHIYNELMTAESLLNLNLAKDHLKLKKFFDRVEEDDKITEIKKEAHELWDSFIESKK
mmetsp:Transcript_8798/g.8347  ORF Transcript_8798/g.8347 Transcript_8798/m.8347 type:complete len:104 (+) Transcript_8798:418-729(+)